MRSIHCSMLYFALEVVSNYSDIGAERNLNAVVVLNICKKSNNIFAKIYLSNILTLRKYVSQLILDNA